MVIQKLDKLDDWFQNHQEKDSTQFSELKTEVEKVSTKVVYLNLGVGLIFSLLAEGTKHFWGRLFGGNS